MSTAPFVLTGASSGIGAAVAEQLVASGRRVIGISRNQDALAAMAARLGPKFEYHSVDLSDDRALEAFVDGRLAAHSSIAGLIHNAGLIMRGHLGSIAAATLDSMLRVNFRAPFLLTSMLLPRLKAERGHLVFINSSAGLHAAAGNAAFCASKFALRALADAARLELNQHGIRVASIYPGRTATPTMERLYADEGRDYRPELLLQPADVAAAVLNIIDAPEHAEITDVRLRPRVKSY
jgi:NADP-dependent 3-hydroxy acid dehydrogenase YdfG